MVNGFFLAIETLIQGLSLGDAPGFKARKPVHRIAAVLLLLGGPLALAKAALPQAPALDAWTILQSQSLTALIFVILALLGLGMPFWRNWTSARLRLGLRRLRLRDILLAVVAGICLYLCAYAATLLWSQALPAHEFAEQTRTARQLLGAFQGLLLPALFLALLTATSEEILFRGALQPVFGILITSLFFTLLHPQTLFTAGALIIFSASLGFGWLRLRLHTGVAIIAHASYNFLPFLLVQLGLA